MQLYSAKQPRQVWSSIWPRTRKPFSYLRKWLTYPTNWWSQTRATPPETSSYSANCSLVSAVRITTSYYSTEATRLIPSNTAFRILGSTQLLNVAKLIEKIDHGHGLIDKIVFATPLAFKPTLSEMEAAKAATYQPKSSAILRNSFRLLIILPTVECTALKMMQSPFYERPLTSLSRRKMKKFKRAECLQNPRHQNLYPA